MTAAGYRYRRACWAGPCTEKGMAIPGFCKCKADADEIERLRNQLVSARKSAIEECAKWLEDIPEHWRTLAGDMRRALLTDDMG